MCGGTLHCVAYAVCGIPERKKAEINVQRSGYECCAGSVGGECAEVDNFRYQPKSHNIPQSGKARRL